MRTAITWLVWLAVGSLVLMALVCALRRLLRRIGTRGVRAYVGRNGTVYLDIPEHGVGEVRIAAGRTAAHVRACTADGGPVRTGVSVHVVRAFDATTVVVAPLARVEDDQ